MSHLILIAGVSRSGKTSLAKRLVEHLDSAIHLDQDDFVLPQSEIPRVRDRVNWETPASIDWVKWHAQISKDLKRFNYVIAEGIFAFNDKKLNELASASISLSIRKAEFLERRRNELRWGEEPDWFIEHVWDSYLKYHNPLQIQPSLIFHDFTDSNFQQVLQLVRSF